MPAYVSDDVRKAASKDGPLEFGRAYCVLTADSIKELRAAAAMMIGETWALHFRTPNMLDRQTGHKFDRHAYLVPDDRAEMYARAGEVTRVRAGLEPWRKPAELPASVRVGDLPAGPQGEDAPPERPDPPVPS